MTNLSSLNRREHALLFVAFLLLLVAVLGPAVAADVFAIRPFADQRGWHDMPNAMDVISNLPFAGFGIWGLWRLRRIDAAVRAGRVPESPGTSLDCAWLFFVGLLITAAGSAFYHLQPDTMRLAADRAGMTVAFAGLVGLAVCERVSQRAGWVAAWYTLAGGLLAVACAAEADNVLPWGVVQFGGMGVVLVLALVSRVPGAIGLRLGVVIALYAAAKLLELGDGWVYALSHQLVSGHSLKHLVAAMAALPVLAALRTASRGMLRHNSGAAAAAA